MSADIKITVVDREGLRHELIAPTDMNMNLMEVCKAYEIAGQRHLRRHGHVRLVPLLH